MHGIEYVKNPLHCCR